MPPLAVSASPPRLLLLPPISLLSRCRTCCCARWATGPVSCAAAAAVQATVKVGSGDAESRVSSCMTAALAARGASGAATAAVTHTDVAGNRDKAGCDAADSDADRRTPCRICALSRQRVRGRANQRVRRQIMGSRLTSAQRRHHQASMDVAYATCPTSPKQMPHEGELAWPV